MNLCLLHWQADSYPLCHQGSPFFFFFFFAAGKKTDISGFHDWLHGSAIEIGNTGGTGLEGEDNEFNFRPADLEVSIDIQVLSKKENPFLDFRSIRK